jgi:hypothetical protein
MGRLKARVYGVRYQQDAVDLGSWNPPTVRRTTDDGDVVIEKVPSTASVRMVNPAGHIVCVTLHNGMGRPHPNATERLEIEERKLKAGFVPLHACPKSLGLHEWLPKAMRDRGPCQIGAGGGPISDEDPCECIGAIIAARTKANNKAMAEIQKRYESRESREQGLLADVAMKLAEKVGIPAHVAPTPTKKDKAGE